MISVEELNARHAEKAKTDLCADYPCTNPGKSYYGIYFTDCEGYCARLNAGLPIRSGYVDWYDDKDEAEREFEKLTPLSFGTYSLETKLEL